MSRKLTSNQSGLVSIMVTMIMVLVISLIVLGFAQITRRNQRENLDSQLSSQAYYAAESGVNDAIPVLQSAALAGTPLNTTNCNSFAATYLNPKGKFQALNGNGTVAYTCLLVNNTPPTLEWGTITNGRAKAIPVNTGSTNLTTLNVSWKSSDNLQLDPATCGAGNQLPPNTAAGWKCSYGLLRLDLMQDNGATDTNAASAANDTVTFFLKPNTSSSAYTLNDFGQAAKGVLLRTNCAAGSCSASIGLSGGASSTKYYARITAVYRDLQQVVISGQSGVNFVGAQAIIDSTGKAQDVLRRIQVHVPLVGSSDQASAAVQSTGSICKLLSVTPPSAKSACTAGPTLGGPPAAPSVCTAAHDIVLVLDSSSSMQSTWETGTRQQELEKVADTFVDNSGITPAGNNVAVVSFNATGVINTGYTSVINTLKNAIGNPFNGHGTSYLAGLAQANNVFSKSGRPGVQKVMIFISDGRPDAEQPPAILNETDALKKQGILIYAIGIADTTGTNIDTSILSNMASDPQSTYYTSAKTNTNFEKFFAGISTEVSC